MSSSLLPFTTTEGDDEEVGGGGGEGRGRRGRGREENRDAIDQIEMSDVSGINLAYRNEIGEDLNDDENASILANDVNASVEEQIRVEEEAENAGRRDVQIDPLVAAGIDRPEGLIPNQSVTLGALLRSDSFMTILYSIGVISALIIALRVDGKHTCTTDAPPLKTWAVVQLVFQCVSFCVNYTCVRIYVSDPEAAT